MTFLDRITLADIKAQPEFFPELAACLRVRLVNSYEDFVDGIYLALDEIIGYLEETRALRVSDSEDRLTVDIVGLLRQRGYSADHDPFINGHVDIRIQHSSGYSWLCEAKIHGAYSWLEKGFNQLSTRYSEGTPGHDRGGVLIYIRTGDAKGVMERWRLALGSVPEISDLVLRDCNKRYPLAFYSTHKHAASGCLYDMRHMGVVLHYAPKDIS